MGNQISPFRNIIKLVGNIILLQVRLKLNQTAFKAVQDKATQDKATQDKATQDKAAPKKLEIMNIRKHQEGYIQLRDMEMGCFKEMEGIKLGYLPSLFLYPQGAMDLDGKVNKYGLDLRWIIIYMLAEPCGKYKVSKLSKLDVKQMNPDVDGILPGVCAYFPNMTGRYPSQIEKHPDITGNHPIKIPGMSDCPGQSLLYYVSGYAQQQQYTTQVPSLIILEAFKKRDEGNMSSLCYADINGNTPLFFPSIIIYVNLRDHGYIDREGQTYNNLKHYLRTFPVICELIKYGCDINHINNYGMSPLLYWVYQCVPVKYINFLIVCGANLSCPFLVENNVNLIDLLHSSPFKNENFDEILGFLTLQYTLIYKNPINMFKLICADKPVYATPSEQNFCISNSLKKYTEIAKGCYAAFFGGTGCSIIDGNELVRIRFLTGAHGLRPIRKRLIEYLVSDEERKEEKKKINIRFKFNECLIELYKRQYSGLYDPLSLYDPLKHSGQYNEKRTILRLQIVFAYYIYEKYDEDGLCINDPGKKLIKKYKYKYMEIHDYSQILYDKKIINYCKERRYMTYDKEKKLVELSVYTQLEDSRFWNY